MLEAGNGAFMFPDVYEDNYQEGEPSAVGIIIADDTIFNIEGNLLQHGILLHYGTAISKF